MALHIALYTPLKGSIELYDPLEGPREQNMPSSGSHTLFDEQPIQHIRRGTLGGVWHWPEERIEKTSKETHHIKK